MTIDFYSTSIVVLTVASLFFGYSYFKARFEDRMRAYTQRMDDLQTWFDRENERVFERISRMEHRISEMRLHNDSKSKYPSDKTYYNAEV